MSTVKAHLDTIRWELTQLMEDHCQAQNQLIAVNDVENAMHEVQKSFESVGGGQHKSKGATDDSPPAGPYQFFLKSP